MFKNFHLKLLAIVGACIFWFVIISISHNIKKVPHPIPIKAYNLAPKLAIKNNLEGVNIKVSSPTLDFSKIKPEDFKAFIDLQNLNIGTHTTDIQVTTENKDITIVEIDPKKIIVELEEKVSKEVPIQIIIQGSPLEGYQQSEPIVPTKTAKISGIFNTINTLSNVKAIISLRGNETTDIQKSVPLMLSENTDNEYEHIEIIPAEIDVYVPIVHMEQIKTVGIKPVFQGKLPKADLWISEIKFNPSTIQVQGKKNFLDSIENIETEPIVLDNVNQSMIKRINLMFPDNIHPAENEKASTLLELTLSPISLEKKHAEE